MVNRDRTRAEARYSELENARGPVLHIRFEGTSRDIPLDLLNLKLGASDADIRSGVSSYLDVGTDRLQDYVVERHANGNLTLRPEAVFG